MPLSVIDLFIERTRKETRLNDSGLVGTMGVTCDTAFPLTFVTRPNKGIFDMSTHKEMANRLAALLSSLHPLQLTLLWPEPYCNAEVT